MPELPYDHFASIYDAWVETVPIAEEMREFYAGLMAESERPVVELGVGNGRISIEAARRGQRVIGVDSSTAILELCRERAAAAGVADRLELIQADFLDFELGAPAALVVIPFHSIGHLSGEREQLACMRRVWEQLRPGGRFVWDHFVFDPDYGPPPGTLNLRAETRDPETGHKRLVWECSNRDTERQVIDILVRIEDLAEDGALEATRYVSLEMRWIEPTRGKEMLRECGFEIEELYGDFRRGSFDAESTHQVWVARRP